MAKKIIMDILPRVHREKRSFEKRKEHKWTWAPKVLSKTLWLVAALVLTALTLNNFSTVRVRVIPRQKTVQVDAVFEARRGEAAADGKLSFETAQMETEDSAEGEATGFSEEGNKASGIIIVYNTYGVNDQRLIARTRFESVGGKIYRTKTPVVVPGFGSTETTVYAEEAGPDYNIGLTDFTVPGLKGDPRYEKIYARSKTIISGGSTAGNKIISEKDILQATEKLKEKIIASLGNAVSNQVPEKYVFYKNSLTVAFSEGQNFPRVGDTADGFVLPLKGNASGILLNKKDLSKTLAEKFIKDFDSVRENAFIMNLEKLNFTLLSGDASSDEITFRLEGNGVFVWEFDESALINDLISAKKGDYQKIFGNYPSIERAEIIFQPGWWQFFPKNHSRVKMEKIVGNERE